MDDPIKRLQSNCTDKLKKINSSAHHRSVCIMCFCALHCKDRQVAWRVEYCWKHLIFYINNTGLVRKMIVTDFFFWKDIAFVLPQGAIPFSNTEKNA